MSHAETLRLSTPLERDYNVFGVNLGDDVSLSIPIPHDEWVDAGYNITIYDEQTRDTLVSVRLDSDPMEVVLDDFQYDTKRALVVVEDRRDLDDIEIEETIAYIVFADFPGGKTIIQQLGFASYLNADGSTLAVPHFQTEFGDGPDVEGYLTYTDKEGVEHSVPYYDEPTNLFP